MLEFLQSAAGRAVLGVFIAVVVLIILDLNYRFFTKAVLDFIFAFVAVIILSPLLVPVAVVSKVKAGKVFKTSPYLGVKCKIIYLHTFAGISGKLKYLARIFDVLGGSLSFVGVQPLEISDGALTEDDKMERFNARPGLICHMVLRGYEGVTYEDMFDFDAKYAKKRELFTDIFIFFKWLVYSVRGEGKFYLGEAKDASYTQTLFNRGAITEEGLEKARRFAEETLAQSRRN